jgi:hypothetical protein
MATLLQQWARRYLQIVQQNHPPHIHAHIREYFYQDARRFGLFGLVELLPFLLIVSVLLFFVGLVVFAFLANHTVAKFTLAIVGFCFLSYITFTLMPLVFHDCPYWTPLTTVLWFSGQKVGLALYWVRDRGATYFRRHWGLLSEGRVELYHQIHEKKAKLWSEDLVSQLEDSAKRPSMEIYRKTLVWTIDQLDKDHNFEEFVAGIPDLYESLFFLSLDGVSLPGTIRPVIATLPGPKIFDAPLSWCIIRFALAAVGSNLSKNDQKKRIQTSFRALYHIPGAIRDLLAPYRTEEYYCAEMIPLLNTPESLDIINELWSTYLNDDAALSVRCVAAVVAAFIITPPRDLLHGFLDETFGFIGDENTGKQFLSMRLCVGPMADGGVAPELHPNSDSARLQNIVRFLADIMDTPQHLDVTWRSDNLDSIRRERQLLFETRHTPGYLHDYGIFDQRGDRASPTFVLAVEQDLIILTLEILARDPVANAGTTQRAAFCDAFMKLEHHMTIPAAQSQLRVTLAARRRTPAEVHALPVSREVLEPSAQVQAPDFIQMIRCVLDPVFQALQVPPNVPPSDDRASSLSMPVPENVTPYDDHVSSLPMPVPQNITPYDDHAASLPMPLPQIATTPSMASLIFPYSTLPPLAGPSTDAGGSGDSHV